MAPGSREYFPESMRISCGKRRWENWPETAPPSRKCQVQSLVMRVLTLAKCPQQNWAYAAKLLIPEEITLRSSAPESRYCDSSCHDSSSGNLSSPRSLFVALTLFRRAGRLAPATAGGAAP